MTLLLAANPLLDSVRASLNDGVDNAALGAFAISIVLFLLVLLVAARFFNQESVTAQEPEIDYLTVLVDLLGLTEEARRDLRRVAAVTGLAQPSSFLLTPTGFAHAVRHPRLGPTDVTFLRRMNDLSRQLFNEPLRELEPASTAEIHTSSEHSATRAV